MRLAISIGNASHSSRNRQFFDSKDPGRILDKKFVGDVFRVGGKWSPNRSPTAQASQRFYKIRPPHNYVLDQPYSAYFQAKRRHKRRGGDFDSRLFRIAAASISDVDSDYSVSCENEKVSVPAFVENKKVSVPAFVENRYPLKQKRCQSRLL
jgi:hypothetical protein